MSIINQTLRELDARRSDAVPAPPPLHPVPQVLRRRPWPWAVALVLLGLAAAATWFLTRPVVTAPQLPTGPAQPMVTPHAPSVPASESPAMPGDTVAADAAVEPKPPAADPLALPPAAAPVHGQAAPALRLAPRIEAPEPKLPPADAARLPQIQKQLNPASAEEAAEDRYRKAVALLQQGRENQARSLLDEAVRLFPGHIAARQTLATLLSEAGKGVEAEAVLREGRVVAPDNAWFALSLARLQAARGDSENAAATLQVGLGGRGVNGEYHATLAALLLQLKRYPDAVLQYQQALRLQPEQGTWWMGLGLSMAAQGKTEEARLAYTRALAAGNLPDNLVEFVRAKQAE